MQIETIGKLSTTSQPHIRKTIEQAIQGLPEEIKRALADVKIVLAKRLVDIDPAYAKTLGRGMRGETLDETYGLHLPDTKRIQLAQEYRVSNSCSDEFNYRASEADFYHVFMHEAGHAFDNTLDGTWSNQPQMKHAYHIDLRNIKQMSKKQKRSIFTNFAYYFPLGRQGTQPDEKSARKEVFAEAFAILLIGTNNMSDPWRSRKHRTIFSNCYDVIEEIIINTIMNSTSNCMQNKPTTINIEPLP